MKSNKVCAVPMCGNTSKKCPDKLFILVPKSCPKRRKLWLQLARRDPKFTPEKTTFYFCEDHFDLPNDMENYIQYIVMGSVNKIKMKPDCLPSKFLCQSDRIKRTRPPKSRSAVSKRERMEKIQGIMSKKTKMPAISGRTSNNDSFHTDTEKDNSFCSNFQNQAIQQQTISQAKDKNTSPFKINIASTSPFNFAKSDGAESARFGKTINKRDLLFSRDKFKVSYSSPSPCKPSQSNTDTSPSLTLLRQTSLSSDQGTVPELSIIKRNIAIENTLWLIKNKPSYFKGISKDCFFLIDLIQKHTNLSEEHILLCLKKIHLNTPFSKLGDQFGISTSHASKIFKKSVPLIARKLYPFILKSNKRAVKQNLPMAFRHKYNIYCIIDCLEIEIQKPSKSIEQALTWSEYKKENTAKYLISSTPDGIINYISPGYGGRITDNLLVQNCSFLDNLEPGLTILAGRGFEQIEELLFQKGINLVRPPSVSSDCKLFKNDVIERVIRRLREFSMLKPSVVNKQLVKYLDDCVVIACALINLGQHQ